jgi:hypothetical protein
MGTGIDTVGVVVTNASQNLNLRTRKAVFIEKCPEHIVDEVQAKFEAIL